MGEEQKKLNWTNPDPKMPTLFKAYLDRLAFTVYRKPDGIHAHIGIQWDDSYMSLGSGFAETEPEAWDEARGNAMTRLGEMGAIGDSFKAWQVHGEMNLPCGEVYKPFWVDALRHPAGGNSDG